MIFILHVFLGMISNTTSYPNRVGGGGPPDPDFYMLIKIPDFIFIFCFFWGGDGQWAITLSYFHLGHLPLWSSSIQVFFH